jgi:hypothetical protein
VKTSSVVAGMHVFAADIRMDPNDKDVVIVSEAIVKGVGKHIITIVDWQHPNKRPGLGFTATRYETRYPTLPFHATRKAAIEALGARHRRELDDCRYRTTRLEAELEIITKALAKEI